MAAIYARVRNFVMSYDIEFWITACEELSESWMTAYKSENVTVRSIIFTCWLAEVAENYLSRRGANPQNTGRRILNLLDFSLSVCTVGLSIYSRLLKKESEFVALSCVGIKVIAYIVIQYMTEHYTARRTDNLFLVQRTMVNMIWYTTVIDVSGIKAGHL